jgi:hypothetical protein
MKATALILVCLVAFTLAWNSPADAVLNRIDSLVRAANDE